MLKVEITPWFIGLKNWYFISRYKNNMKPNVHLHHTRYSQWAVVFWKESFLSTVLNSGLKIFSQSWCKQMCCQPGFLVPPIEHRQRRFSIILKGLRIYRIDKPRTYCMAQENISKSCNSIIWWNQKKIYMYIYIYVYVWLNHCVIHLKHNIVNQLHFNLKKSNKP